MTTKRFTMKGSTILENGEEITAWDCYDLLNELHSQNKRLKKKIQRERNSFRKTQERWSKEAEDKIKELSEKNEHLKEDNKILNRINDKVNGWNGLAHDKIFKLEKENERLKERNNRQAKRLAEVYELMAKKDWESLTEIIDDFCSCEEQLQREWRTYE